MRLQEMFDPAHVMYRRDLDEHQHSAVVRTLSLRIAADRLPWPTRWLASGRRSRRRERSSRPSANSRRTSILRLLRRVGRVVRDFCPEHARTCAAMRAKSECDWTLL